MTLRALIGPCFAVLLTVALAHTASAQAFSDNFDAAPVPGAWTVTLNATAAPAPDFGDATLDFDYSSVGIPSAPNSTGGTTKGMRLRANIGATDLVGAVNVSPTGKTFAGDYSLKFDLWSNFIGDDAAEDMLRYGGNNSTHFSMYGVMSNGGPNRINGTTGLSTVESLFFTNSGDGQSLYDYRVYGPGKTSGYRGTSEVAYSATADAGVAFGDVYPALYPAYAGPTYAGQPHPDAGETNRGVDDDQNANYALTGDPDPDGFLYIDAFPSASVPAQAAIAPFNFSQAGATMAGAMGMAWREVEVRKVGNIVTWNVLDTAIGDITIATVDLTTIGGGAPTGSNIMFGHSDNLTGARPTNFEQLMFTLIDNVRVESLAVTPDADFDADGDVDGADFLTWQRGLGADGDLIDGNANGDNIIDAADLAIWKASFSASAATPAAAAVPEPSALGLAMLAVGAMLASGKPRRRQ